MTYDIKQVSPEAKISREALAEQMAECAAQVESAMLTLLRETGGDASEEKNQLTKAMRHGCLNGGKRMRPFMVMESAAIFGVNPDCALRVAAAIEFVHSYSLVHDDLPAMDNADLRRGKPTVHKVYDDATAILAGDGLLTYAFEILSEPETHEDPQVRCNLIKALATSAGPAGMVGGQMLDLLAEKTPITEAAEITRLQRLKTGELIAFSCQAGAILGRASPPQRTALHAYAHDLGLAFQIVDDLLDAHGTAEETGKPVGQDNKAGKATFVSILGPERAREQADMLARQAAEHLNIFEDRAATLQALARFVVERRT
jgi:farnesyl diphosphate synthase